MPTDADRRAAKGFDDFLDAVGMENYSPMSTISMSILIAAVLSFIGACNYYLSLSATSLGLVSQMMSDGANDADNATRTQNRLILNGAGLFLTVYGAMFAVIFGVYYKGLLHGTDNFKAAKIVGVCLLAVLGSAFLATSPVAPAFLGLVCIFENTVGYAIANLVESSNINSAFHVLFKHDWVPESGAKSAFPEMEIPYQFILSTLSVTNFASKFKYISGGEGFDFSLRTEKVKEYAEHSKSVTEFIKQLVKTDGDVANTGPVREFLAKMVVLKYSIGQMCWIFFACLVATIVCLKFLS